MARKTRGRHMSAKVLAAIMSVSMGFSNLSLAMPGAVAYAENDNDEASDLNAEVLTDSSSEGSGTAEGGDSREEETETTEESVTLTETAGEEKSTEEDNKEETEVSDTDASSEEQTDDKDSIVKEGKVEDEEKKESSTATRSFDNSKTDVWDFGAEDLGDSYNNRLDVDTINGFYTVEPGTTGVTLPSFSVDDGDFEFNDGGNPATHRLRTINTSLTRKDEKSLKDEAGNVYTGYLYSNAASTDAVYVALECEADDTVIAYVSSNGGASDVHFRNMEDASDDVFQTHTLGSGTATKMTFYPSQDSKYKLFSSSEKLVVARVLREHANYGTVSGTVTGYEGTGSFDIVFTNQKNGNEVVASVSGGAFTAQLAEGFDYKLSLRGADTYVITSDNMVNISGDECLAVTVEEIDLVNVTGKITGIAEADLESFVANAEFTFVPGDEKSVYVPDIKVDAKADFEVSLQKDITYTLVVEGVDDYTLLTETVKFSKDADNAEISFVKKDEVPLVIESKGLALADLKDATFRFTLLDKEKEFEATKYAYEFSGEDVIAGKAALRAGQYDVLVEGVPSGYIQNVAHTRDAIVDEEHVKDGKLNVEIPFESTTKEKTSYKETVTVGAGKDYETISAAIEAIRNMDRAEEQRVTVEIAPGDYQEMLVIDTPNVTLKNATAGGSIVTTGKGVSVASDSVRITGYYGHGYTYYSMGSDCKYDAELLEVNKYNGYASFVNPGSGTTAGSYWNATVVVDAAGFEASDIIFENSFNQYQSALAAEDVIVAQSGAKEAAKLARAYMEAGDVTVQEKAYVERAAALAMTKNATEAYYDHCAFIGRQDTLYGAAGSTEAFYDCDIYGGTDYIFGGMTAVFAKCDLVFNTSDSSSNDVGYITAAQQTSASSRGYLMYNCTVKSTTPGENTASTYGSKPGYLGRPWAANTSEVVFFNTVIDATCEQYKELSESLIMPAGWLSTLSGTTLRNVEYGTYEASAVDNSASRVEWAPVSDKAETTDGKAIAVSTFLGDWNPFAANDKDMTIVLPDGTLMKEPVGDILKESETNVFTFESSSLTAFDAGAKADGATETAGTDGYFTLIYSAKTKVDSSSKTWEDEYTSPQRLNFGDKMSLEKNVVKFTTSNSASVKVWWVQGGDDSRQMALLDASGSQVAITEGTYTKNSPYISELKAPSAGTYYLGGATGNNNIYKIVVTEDVAAEPVTYSFASSDLTAFDAGAKADGATETAGTDGYFTLIYSAKTKVDSSSKTWEDDYTSPQRLNFGDKMSLEKNAVKFTTSGPASVKVWWVQGGDDSRQMAILNSSGEQVSITSGTYVKNSPYISELSVSAAGTYYLGGATGNNNIYKVEVTEGAPVVVTRAAWDEVAAPVISTVTLDEANAGNILVKVTSEIGTNGGDKLVVTMLDSKGKEVDSLNSSAEKKEFDFAFTPEKSDKYTFVATLSREDEETVKTSEKSEAFAFVLPLKAPEFKNAVNMGGGKVKVNFYSTPEATAYVLTATDKTDSTKKPVEKKISKTAVLNSTTEYTYSFTGLTVGHSYELSLYATRSADKSEANTLEVTVTQNAETEWVFSAFGQGVTKGSTSGFTKNDDGSVTVWNTNNKGKLVPASTDGLAFYYTAVPASKNFTFTAKATIDTWTFTNGQEGFGLMAADRVGVNGDGSVFWNNSYMASGTKVEYYYDKDKKEVTNVDTADKISMKLGLGAQEKVGVTKTNLEKLEANDTATVKSDFSSKMYPLETSCGEKGAGTYNLFGKEASGTVKGTVENPLTEITLRIRKNNTGYFVSYLDAEGNELGLQKFYDTKALQKLDSKYVYVGVFAARTFKATFSDIELTLIDPSKDDKPESQTITYVEPNYKVLSATYSNTEKYTFQFTGNADGVLTVTDRNEYAVLDNLKVKSGAVTTAAVRLAKGDNKFTVTFTPNKSFRPGGDAYKRLSSYETATIEHVVSYAALNDGAEKVYVAPSGTAKGDGSNENPVDIYTAVKYVQPGQTIVLAGGTYSLNETVIIERGIDGTASKPIKMVTENGRAVFDFNSACAGFILAGNYWNIKGIDCTRSANGEKGIQVSGSHITLEDIHTYNNGNTGIQVSRYLSSDKRADWPSYNLILNCTSYNNADAGYEDADGFAAKLTCGDGIVFDGCIAYNNADDGWDLFAKVESGSIGEVTIRNCVAFSNGFGLDGKTEGNGNGFKMGGSSMAGAHRLINSVAWGNRAKGIDSNSGPDIQVYNSMSFNNGSNNVALYTNDAANTNYYVDGLLSFRTEGTSVDENLKLKGTQDEARVYGANNFFWVGGASSNVNGLAVAADWFVDGALVSPVADAADPLAVATALRTEDGSINLGNFLKLSDKGKKALEDAGLAESEIVATVDGKYDALTDESAIEGSSDNASQKLAFEIENFDIEKTYTGNKITQDMTVYYGDTLLRQGVDYTVSYKNNVKVGTATATIAGKGNYSGKTVETFNIVPANVADAAVVVTAVNETGKAGKNPSVKAAVYYMGKTLSVKKDYTIAADFMAEPEVVKEGDVEVKLYPVTVTGIGNFGGVFTDAKLKVYPKGTKAVTDYTGFTMLKNGSIELAETTFEYTGSKIEPAVKVYAGKGSSKGEALDAANYVVEYTGNVNKGTATVTVIGVEAANCVGTLTAKFSIKAVDMVTAKADGKLVVTMSDSAEYMKGGAKPVPVVELNGAVLREGVDYKLAYQGNTKVSSAGDRSGVVTVKGIGNFTGSVDKSFSVTAKSVTKASVVTTDKAVKSTAKGNSLISKPVVYDENGKALKEKTDYTVEYYYGGKKIDASTTLSEGNNIVKVVVKGVGGYTEDTEATYYLRELKKLSKVKNEKIAAQKYTGSAVRPDGQLKLYNVIGTGKSATNVYLNRGVDYEIVLCFNNINQGTATYILKGKGEYSGYKTVTFKIKKASAR